ncbi:hypothetical protein FHP05_13215 [Cerasibacillus terrae]|uniref:Uncharacterized protein n=1 Tax=Cerasibacillus terrae TaxID=2498845 RepID=A0A5C8NMF0_9BACI|nr:hypothetical protein [Cerasibacillus terrae]TXL61643.1 hypothetical protein FHP05_13215 [Cerasibacillus terrae]
MFVISITIFGVMVSTVSASTSEDGESNANEEDYTKLGAGVKVKGELSEVEYNTANDLECVACGVPKYKVIKKSSPKKKKRFVRYLTGSWAKSDGYIWSKSQNASATLSANVGLSAKSVSSSIGVSNTVTTTYSVAISIPANKKSLSKLAFYSDYNRRLITTKLNVYPHTVKKGYHYAPRKDTYLQVVYK